MNKQQLQERWTNAFIKLIMDETIAIDISPEEEQKIIILALQDTINYLSYVGDTGQR